MCGCGPVLRLIHRNVHVNCIPLRPRDQSTHYDEQEQKDGESATRTHRPHMRRTILSLLATVGFSDRAAAASGAGGQSSGTRHAHCRRRLRRSSEPHQSAAAALAEPGSGAPRAPQRGTLAHRCQHARGHRYGRIPLAHARPFARRRHWARTADAGYGGAARR